MRAAALAVLLGLGCSADRVAGLERLPNIVLIVADDQGYAELSCQGGDVPTPNLDRLAASGARFTAGYVTSPYCSPSRAGLLTGRYQQRFGHEHNTVGTMNDRPEVGLPLTEPTLADRLRERGYATGLVGKWHLGVHPPQHPRRRGFDEFFGFLREGHYYYPPPYDGPPSRLIPHFRPKEPDYDRDNPILRGEARVEEPEYLTQAFGREAEAFIERHAKRPFFLYLPFNAPHSPMQAATADYDRFTHIADPHRRTWAGMLSSMDQAVGRVTTALRRLGLERETLVIFISDNGGPTKELTSRNDPFRGGKGSLLEGGIRVPYLMSWPGRIEAGRVEPRPASALDVVPTALAAAESPIPDGLDGVNLLPWLSGTTQAWPARPLFWRLGGQVAIQQWPWKLVRLKPGEPFRYYELGSDPKEDFDLREQHVVEARRLEARLAAWEAGLMPPRW
jgi:arylsulfatase B